MNTTSHYIMGIYQLNLLLRDSLEYMLPNRTFTVDVYEKRQKGIASLLSENSPFSSFVKNNGEKAEEVMNNFRNFEVEVYSDKGSIVKIHSDQVEVDQAKHIAFYEMVVGLFQTVEDILQGYLNHAKKTNTYEESLEKAINSNEYYFRTLSHLVIVHDLIKAFNEFQVAMRESKGEPSPVANFINDDITKYYGFIAFQKKHNRVKDASYHEMLDKVNMLVQAMSGKRSLPEGTTFPDLFKDVEQSILKEVEKSEALWKVTFAPVMNEYIKFSKEAAEKAQKKMENLA
jgi:hypothetical protein